ncbi:UNVERIFIED_CONTAM: ADAMTS-like protein 5 [Trichonephila clavipes]
MACSSLAEEFLDYQCSKRNGQVIGGRRINEWVPYRYGRNPCELQCWAKDRSLVYSFGKVTDGTPCSAEDPKDPALCVNGRCMQKSHILSIPFQLGKSIRYLIQIAVCDSKLQQDVSSSFI